MNKYLLFIGCFLFISAVSYSQTFVPIFNGKDLSGWHINGTEKWYVENGVLMAESGPDKDFGYLNTEKNYKNFILTLDFIQYLNGNSGVFIRSTIEGLKISGWQVEIAPPGQHTGGIYESYGREWLLMPKPKKEKILKMGEWNHMKIKVNGDIVTTWLNGKKMICLRDKKVGKGVGSIALQIHSRGGIKLGFKNILIKELK